MGGAVEVGELAGGLGVPWGDPHPGGSVLRLGESGRRCWRPEAMGSWGRGRRGPGLGDVGERRDGWTRGGGRAGRLWGPEAARGGRAAGERLRALGTSSVRAGWAAVARLGQAWGAGLGGVTRPRVVVAVAGRSWVVRAGASLPKAQPQDCGRGVAVAVAAVAVGKPSWCLQDWPGPSGEPTLPSCRKAASRAG